jgi:hypothetical protein
VRREGVLVGTSQVLPQPLGVAPGLGDGGEHVERPGELGDLAARGEILRRLARQSLRGVEVASGEVDRAGQRTPEAAERGRGGGAGLRVEEGHTDLARLRRPPELSEDLAVVADGATRLVTVPPADQFELMLESFVARLRGEDDSGVNEGEDVLRRMRIISDVRDQHRSGVLGGG